MAPNFKIIGFSEIVICRRKIFGLLLLVKKRFRIFIGKSLNLAHLTLQVPLGSTKKSDSRGLKNTKEVHSSSF